MKMWNNSYCEELFSKEKTLETSAPTGFQSFLETARRGIEPLFPP